MKLFGHLIICAMLVSFVEAATRPSASKLSVAAKKPSMSKYAALYKFLGGVKNTMIKNTNEKKQKLAMKQESTTSLRTKHTCNMCRFLIKRNGAKRKRCAIYLKMNAHKCNPNKSEFISLL